ncbi:tRNA epoxyqueuosine(34) reductase QueG [Zavarzinella formosa]|uniref:tRNA epoxyqueuosine(34) reductase QueG n=1 Tax=Zavarzinella formosa TaxID=360055 RepID=UPI000A01E4B8|nr:tRNA epoxyqueuosine(34) reductase QueG [Zavarzinella formosa]
MKAKCLEQGFALAGIARASEADHFERFQEWLSRGFAGEMAYLTERAELRRHPESMLPGVRSVIMVALTYPTEIPPGGAKVGKYAHGPDYHEFCRDKLNLLRDWLQSEILGCTARGVTDSAPLLERDFARRAGLGWFGKNTMLINKQLGSFFFLAGLLTTLELEPDAPHTGSHCGTCTACLDACPTDAFAGPGMLDARKCISYLTIESKKPMPLELRPNVGEWFFGCDVCQDVCPWNRHGNANPGLPMDPAISSINLIELFTLSGNQIRKRFEGSALLRANWRSLLRNAAIVLGNQRATGALPALRQGASHADPMVREACEWAIGQIIG